jgi:hypothetical protein
MKDQDIGYEDTRTVDDMADNPESYILSLTELDSWHRHHMEARRVNNDGMEYCIKEPLSKLCN